MAVTINGSGQVPVQVISTAKTDTFTMSSGTFTDVTGYSVTITPTNSSNKILVFVSSYLANSASEAVMLNVLRNGTSIVQGDTAGSRISTAGSNGFTSNNLINVGVTYLDSPATTSAVTYKVQIRVQSGTAYVNRTWTDSDNGTYPRTASTITVMEISG